MVYNETGASLAEFFHLLLDTSAPAIWPEADIRTTAARFEALFPAELLSCAAPARRSGEKPGRGRPAASGSQKPNSFLAFLYNGYNNAKARRAAMADVLRDAPVRVIRDTEKKAEQLLYADGLPQFDQERLESVLLDDFCVPFQDEERKNRYRTEISWYCAKAPEKAFARAVLALLLQEQAENCFALLFPAEERNDDSPQTLAQSAYDLEARGLYGEARELWRQLLRAGGEEAAHAYYEIGRMLQNGLGCRKDLVSAIASFEEANERSASGVHPAASLALYRHWAAEGDAKKAAGFLRQSLEAGSADAAREMGNLHYHGASMWGIRQNIEEAARYYRMGAQGADGARKGRISAQQADGVRRGQISAQQADGLWNARADGARSSGDPVCQRMLGRCLDALGNAQEAAYWYERAARGGDEDAAYYWMQQTDGARMAAGQSAPLHAGSRSGEAVQGDLAPEKQDKSDKPAGNQSNLCVYNGENEAVETFLSSLDSSWSCLCLGDGSNDFSPESICAESGFDGKKLPAQCVFLLFDDDTEKNLEQLVQITGWMNQKALQDNDTGLIERSRFFVRCAEGDEIAAKVVDSCNAAHEFKRERCFRITLCDPAKDASRWLLTHVPLFLPMLRPRCRKTAIAIVGAGKIVPQLICDMLSVWPVDTAGNPLSVTVIDERAEQICEELRYRAPALFEEQAAEKLPVDIAFFEMSKEQFFHRLESREEGDPGWTKRRGFWNYYIVDGESDRESLQTGIRLRETLTRMDFSRRPLITVHVRSSLLARQASRFSVLGERIGFSWYNQYDLTCFGSPGQLWTRAALLENQLDRQAFGLHCAYYGDAGNQLADAGLDYWSRSYNRDASMQSAISAIYKLFRAGLYLSEKEQYGDLQSLWSFAGQWQAWLDRPGNEEQAVRDEHVRWNYFVCSRGWRQATVEQMRRYIAQGNPRQQLYLAKLHPCIVDWNRLKYVEEQYNQIMRERNPDWKDRDFIESDRIMVRNCIRVE